MNSFQPVGNMESISQLQTKLKSSLRFLLSHQKEKYEYTIQQLINLNGSIKVIQFQKDLKNVVGHYKNRISKNLEISTKRTIRKIFLQKE